MAFHLDVGAGSALAAAVSAPPRMPAPAPPRTPAAAPPRMPAPSISPAPAPSPMPTAGLVSTTPVATPVEALDGAGGRGWGVREQRPALYPTWLPAPVAPGPTGGPSAGGAYAGVGLYPGYGYPGQPSATAPRVGRSRAAFRALILLVFVALVGAGAFLYLSSESTQGLGSGTHTVSAPATLGGLTQDTNSQLTAVLSEYQSTFDNTPGINQTAMGVYGFDAAGSPGYFLIMMNMDQTVTATGLDNYIDGIDRGAGSSFNLSAATITAANGVDYHCTPLTLSGGTGAVCMWVDGNVIGVVAGTGSDAQTLALAEDARSSGEQ